MRTYRLFILIEMEDTEDVQSFPDTIIEERDFACAGHEEAQELLAIANKAVEDSR